jgi:hypothetical protein
MQMQIPIRTTSPASQAVLYRIKSFFDQIDSESKLNRIERFSQLVDRKSNRIQFDLTALPCTSVPTTLWQLEILNLQFTFKTALEEECLSHNVLYSDSTHYTMAG